MNKSLTAGILDLNGQYRGKRFPIKKQKILQTEGFRSPLSLMGVDIWGCDAEGSKLVFETGDGDGKALTIDRGPLVTQLGAREDIFFPAMFFYDDDRPFEADPRQALISVLNDYEAHELTPVVASELEFYLMDPHKIYATAQTSDRILTEFNTVSLDEIDAIYPFLDDVYKLCEIQDIPADTAISENGAGQFEVNLTHRADALMAADDAVFFKRAVKAVARHHRRVASFMAKPFGDRSGNGFHLHVSVLNKNGENIFSRKNADGLSRLEYAISGCMKTMPHIMAILAPHQNSYRRFAPQSHAPSKIAWGFENRTTALRVPGGSDNATRIEHRVAGADANPYLVIAGVLRSILDGLEAKEKPTAPIEGDAYSNDNLTQLPNNWFEAVKLFSNAPFDPLLIHTFTCAKEQEIARFFADVSAFEYRSYLESV